MENVSKPQGQESILYVEETADNINEVEAEETVLSDYAKHKVAAEERNAHPKTYRTKSQELGLAKIRVKASVLPLVKERVKVSVNLVHVRRSPF